MSSRSSANHELVEVKARYYTSNKTTNLSRNIPAKQIEKRCCSFFYPRINLSRIKVICCRLKTFVAEIRRSFYLLQQNFQMLRLLLTRINLSRSKMTSRAFTRSCYPMRSLDSLNCNNLSCCETSLYAGGKTSSIDFQTVSHAAMLRDELGNFIARITVPFMTIVLIK